MKAEEILAMGRKELLNLHAMDVPDAEALTPEAVLHIFRMLDASWFYDYAAAEAGRAGLHAELKSGRHSDGFLNFREASQYRNIQYLMGMSLAKKFTDLKLPYPDFVVGIPDAATGLGADFADALDLKVAMMEKQNGRMRLVSKLPHPSIVLLVEDICTRGTGFTEAVGEIVNYNPGVTVLPFEMVVFNRGGLTVIPVNGIDYRVTPLAERRINDWEPQDCPLCAMGSRALKPKPKDQPENWGLLVNSQLA